MSDRAQPDVGPVPERGSETHTLWHGRFAAGPDAALMAYTASLRFDRRLWRDDIVGSRAHVAGLARVGLLTAGERDAVLTALDAVEAEMSSGRFDFVESDEDIHTAVERRVTELAGAAGAKLHTARSRNDQVATDLRLWCKRELVEVARGLYDLQQVLLTRAIEAGDTYLPGYTHLQRAQPVLLSHHLLAHGWAFGRDIERLFATVDRLDVSPLGAGALAGTSLPIDPAGNAAELGFARVFDNSLDAVSDRDFVAEALFDLALIGVHLSRIGEEWVLWTSEEFGFAVLDDAFATGSSMLPQKKNADIAELARGKAGRLIGNLTGLLATLKGLPLAYNRDLQEDKEGLFDSVDQVNLAVAALTGMIATAVFVPVRMQAAADADVTAATDLAEYLVRQGTPFRDAHAIVAQLVRRHLAGEGGLGELAAAAIDDEAAALVRPGAGVRQRTSPGGAGPVPHAAQRAAYQAMLAREHSDLVHRDGLQAS
jgi:argininosuccinate lyase